MGAAVSLPSFLSALYLVQHVGAFTVLQNIINHITEKSNNRPE
jgi:hypothetical protein